MAGSVRNIYCMVYREIRGERSLAELLHQPFHSAGNYDCLAGRRALRESPKPLCVQPD